MNNIRFLTKNSHKLATLTATSEALSVENTKDARRSFAWRSATLATQTITGTLATATSANCFVFANHNLSAGSSVQLILKLSGVTVYDSGEIDPKNYIPAGVWRAGIDPYGETLDSFLPYQNYDSWFASTVFDSYEIIIKDSGNSDGYIQAGLIMLGSYFSPKLNVSYRPKMEWIEDSKTFRTDGGTRRVESIGSIYRKFAFKLDWLDDEDRITVLKEFMNSGKKEAIYISIYPESGGGKELEHSFISNRESNIEFSNNFYENWQAPMIFEEI